MDTTAAAELGMGDPEGGVAAFWHSGNPSPDHWGDPVDNAELLDDDDDDDDDEDLAWDCPAPAAAVPAPPSGGLAYRARALAAEPPPKLLRSMPDAPLHPSFSGHGAAPPLGRGSSSAAALPHFGSAAAAAVGSSPLGAGAVGRGRGMGSIFYKTKLCSRFRSGNCPYNTNCNFAHGMEELRKPPPGWEEFVASQELPPPMPSQGGAGGVGAAAGSTDSQVRFHKTRPCKKYFGEGNCPYGEKCNFLHDEQSAPRVVQEAREAAVAANNAGASGVVAASPRLDTHPLVPPTNGHLKEKGGGGGGSTSAGSAPPNARPSNWKTRLCNKWETTGHCPCGDNCHFAHGSDELQRYGGGLPDANAPAFSDSKSGGATSRDSSWHQRQHAGGASSARSGSKENSNWRGPSDISTIYGDWWVEDDYWQCGATPASHESTELEGDVWSEAQRPTPLLAPASSTPKPVLFFRRTSY